MHFLYIDQRYKSVKKTFERQERIYGINNDLHIVILNVISSNDICQHFRWHYSYAFIISSPALQKRQENFEALLERQEDFKAY